ncbi:MAG TPA: c-type cytochrome [Tepidisphaeraceae bacterium]|jgi:putative heme-binding domain-containing protein|nr:c-type cytochrome [Tepidisphaeraceae bacterium]
MHTKTFRRTALRAVCCVAGLFGLSTSARAADAKDVSADDYATLPGFKLEVVLKADPKANGSWISLGKDSQGRLMLGGQRHQPMTRLTLDNQGHITKQEVLKLPVSEIMGQLFVNDSLYVDAAGKGPAGPEVFGLFRLRDPKGDGSFDSVELLREWKNGAGEHGAHGIVLAPDKQHIFTVCGNFTGVPDDLAPSSPHKNYQDDLALPRAEDGNGFGAGKKPPGGFITRMNLDGKEAELFASGQRNTYDIAVNADGEVFGFDSDMEWDWGTPWYRPIRVFHATSGGDGGFREGSAKWPTYYADSLPPVQEIGLGCPTGVSFGYGAKFPAKYQKAFYITDWTYGRLIAVHLKPHGASYESTGWENFVAPKGLSGTGPKSPLNLTDIVIGNDGAFYFTIGGRGTGAKLFRVTYTGDEPTTPADLHDADGQQARELRHKLESFHGKANPEALATVWPELDSVDRYIRYAARIAVEAQPVDQWKAKALAETKPNAALTALLALARLGGQESQADLLKSLSRLSIASLSPEQQLDKLRVLEVSISRQGKPAGDEAKAVIAELDPVYPAKSIELNRELCQVLLALDAPDAVAKTVKLLEAAPTQEEQLNYVLALRTIKTGWTPELHRAYFSWWTKDRHANPPAHPDYVLKWFSEAGRPYGDGSSFNNFIAHLHADAKSSCSADEEKSLADVIDAYVPPAGRAAKRPSKVRKMVKEWKMEDLEPSLADVGHDRSFNRGKTAFEDAQCLACHKFGNEGGAVGPDLTAVSSRFARKDILESIVLPSKVISEQFMNTEVRTKSGDVEVGRLVEETADHVVLQPNQLKPEKVTIKKADIQLRRFSKISPMPEGLVNTFSKTEILDILAYIESGGRKSHPDFSGGAK